MFPIFDHVCYKPLSDTTVHGINAHGDFAPSIHRSCFENHRVRAITLSCWWGFVLTCGGQRSRKAAISLPRPLQPVSPQIIHFVTKRTTKSRVCWSASGEYALSNSGCELAKYYKAEFGHVLPWWYGINMRINMHLCNHH